MKDRIILIDKPEGISSFDVIRELRKRIGVRKMGHAGTLDPLATGLLIIGVGEGTKRLHEFLKLPKTYESEILLGVRTDTGDLEGHVLEQQPIGGHPMSPNWENEVREALAGLIGEIELPVPAYSAIKVGGQPLYKRARRGEQFEPPKKPMIIRNIELLDMRKEGEYVVLSVRMDVGSGAYVRSIAEEIGRRLGVPATVKSLRRTQIGDFKIADAKQLGDVRRHPIEKL